MVVVRFGLFERPCYCLDVFAILSSIELTALLLLPSLTPQLHILILALTLLLMTGDGVCIL